MIWILGVVLLMAALDAMPDPPVIKPGAPACQILQPHHDACDTPAPRGRVLSTAHTFALSWMAGGARDCHEGSERVVLTEQASDPSPPQSPV